MIEKFFNKLVVLTALCGTLHSQTIDILVRWDLREVYNQNWNIAKKLGYQVRVFRSSDEYFSKHYSADTKKIIVMEDYLPRNVLEKIPKSKLCLFMWEPIGKTEDADYYSCVYTFNDDLVGTANYRKFRYPCLMPMSSKYIPFQQKKLCAAVISHWLPEKIELVSFFANRYQDQFDLYGKSSGPFSGNPIYKGRIEGNHSASPKINTLKRYKFFLAFENSACPRYNIVSGYCAPGYITEKIFGAFAAGCVPIYYGAPNIAEYIPNDCFIRYLDFQSPRELYDFISNMTEDVYNRYLDNIRAYLKSELAEQFSQRTFELTILQAAGI